MLVEFGGPAFIIAIVAIVTGGRLMNNWIRARHGYEPESKWNRKYGFHSAPFDNGETQRLKAENRELHSKIDAMQDRMVVLERIVTDRGYSLSAEIEALRDPPASGVPTTPTGRERV